MKNVIYMFFVFIICTHLKGYSQIQVNLKEFYRGGGVIFSSNHKLPVLLGKDVNRFTPSVEVVRRAETLLLNNVAGVNYIDLTGIYAPKRLKKTLCRYNRQYVGYQNAELDSIIVVNLMNFSKKKQAGENFSGWQNSYIIGFGEFYEKNRVAISVNLTKREVSMR